MHSNEKLLRDLFEMMSSLDTSDLDMGALFNPEGILVKSITPDISWRMVGEHTKETGVYGVHKGYGEVANLFVQVNSYLENYQMTELVSATANDDMGVTLFRSSGVDNGEPVDIEEVWVFRFRDGQISEIWDYNRIIHLQMVEDGERGRTGY